ncbi:MAG: hypothetical protein WBE26_01600 [Phycisphaerae bacterium]
MFKFNRLALVLAVCVCVGIALGAAIKIKDITPYAGTEEAATGGDGMAIFNYHPGNNETEATVAITDFVPGVRYGTWVIPGGEVNVRENANPAGNANWHGSFGFDLCLWNPDGITVIIWRDFDGNDERAVDGSEDVAEGWVACPQ